MQYNFSAVDDLYEKIIFGDQKIALHVFINNFTTLTNWLKTKFLKRIKTGREKLYNLEKLKLMHLAAEIS